MKPPQSKTREIQLQPRRLNICASKTRCFDLYNEDMCGHAFHHESGDLMCFVFGGNIDSGKRLRECKEAERRAKKK
jgi:hypothetical protein